MQLRMLSRCMLHPFYRIPIVSYPISLSSNFNILDAFYDIIASCVPSPSPIGCTPAALTTYHLAIDFHKEYSHSLHQWQQTIQIQWHVRFCDRRLVTDIVQWRSISAWTKIYTPGEGEGSDYFHDEFDWGLYPLVQRKIDVKRVTKYPCFRWPASSSLFDFQCQNDRIIRFCHSSNSGLVRTTWTPTAESNARENMQPQIKTILLLSPPLIILLKK